jgi:hypothetical protein
MNQSQILIPEMIDADGIQIVRQDAGEAWVQNRQVMASFD